MSEVVSMEFLKVYAITDIPAGIPVDNRYRNISVVVEPWDVSVIPDVLEDIVRDGGNFVDTGAVGTVTLKLQPKHSFRKYDLPEQDGVIDLAFPHFVNIGAPVSLITPVFSGIANCTHVSVSVTGVPY